MYFIFFLILFFSDFEKFIKLPELPPEYKYGNVILNKFSQEKDIRSVIFPHWIHRQKYTCSVCHFELEIEMKGNSNPINCITNKEGNFCGACHNGEISFKIEEKTCDRCHTGDIEWGKEKFYQFKKSIKSKENKYINWSELIEKGIINPKSTLKLDPEKIMKYDKTLQLEAEFFNIPTAIFSHKTHTKWHNCNNCHPDVFNIKKKTTHFYMEDILKGKYCGACHSKVAFPINFCRNCHTGIKRK